MILSHFPFTARRPAPRIGPEGRARLRLEALENRLVPSITPGTILVPDAATAPTGTPGVLGIDPNTGSQTVITSGNLLVTPQDVREGSDGNLYIADNTSYGQGAIIKYDPSSNTQTRITSGQYFMAPAALEWINGKIIVADPGPFTTGGDLVSVDPGTGIQTVIAKGGDLANPAALAPVPGNSNSVYVGDATAFGTGAVFRIDLTTGAQTLITTGQFIDTVASMVVDARGHLIVTNTGSDGTGTLVHVDPVTGAQTLLASGGKLDYSPNGSALIPDGQFFVSTLGFSSSQTDVPSIIRVHPVTGVQTTVSSGGSLGYPGNLAVYQAASTPAPLENVSLAGGVLTAAPVLSAGVSAFTGDAHYLTCHAQPDVLPDQLPAGQAAGGESFQVARLSKVVREVSVTGTRDAVLADVDLVLASGAL